eukprot:gene15039-16757_t
MSLPCLPDSLLQTIHSYLDYYDQRVFLVLNSEFARLGEGISIINVAFATFLKSLRSKRWRNIENGYDRINLNFFSKYFNQINECRGWIIRSYRKRMEEESREGRQLPAPSERLYEMVMEIWPFTSLRNLLVDLRNVVFLLEKNKLIKVQKLAVCCDANMTKEDTEASLIKLFDLLRNNQLQLKELEIIRDADEDDEPDIEVMPYFPYFSRVNGLLKLCVQGFRIPPTPGDGFKCLQWLELDCMVECESRHFDGVGCLVFQKCEGIRGLGDLKITRNVHILGMLNPEDRFYTASHLELEIGEEANEPVHLAKYENAHTLYLSGWSDTTLIMPERLSDKLRDLRIESFVPLTGPFPPNKLKFIEFANTNPQQLLSSLSNIEYVQFSNCALVSLDSLGSGIKGITVSGCTMEDYSPLGRFEKVSIKSCEIRHPLKLKEVKELTIQWCKCNFNEELN